MEQLNTGESTANETVIQFSKWKTVWFTAMVFVVIGGISALIQGGSVLKYIMAVISILVGFTLAYSECRNLMVLNKPQLIISDKGIQTHDGRFYSWDTISNEKMVPLGSVKPTWYLWFEAPYGNRKLPVSDLNKSPEQIMALIRQYRWSNK